mmetsp:Transcript_149105/g.285737  ORF Transcript_149105/g.285737 Transcript_149105/m.285737 type:complete len:502 (+) Transcript_149105:139-1644(+)
MMCADSAAWEACGSDDKSAFLQQAISLVFLNASEEVTVQEPASAENTMWSLLLLLFMAVVTFSLLLIATVMAWKGTRQDRAVASEAVGLGGLSPSSFTLGVIGTCLEFYDFGLFGFFAAELGETFFPGDSKFVKVSLAFATYGGAFLMRPLGGIISGYIGDSYGRVTALRFCLLGMICSTTAIGLVSPTSEIGIVAPMLILLARLIQGISVGGQLPSAIIYTLEHAQPDSRCLVCAILNGSANTGMFLSSLVCAASHSIGTDTAWRWRCPFISATFVGVLGYWVSWKAEESDEYVTACSSPRTEQQHPLSSVFEIAKIGILTQVWTVTFYTIFTWLPTYEQHLRSPPAVPYAFSLNTAALGVLVILLLFWAWIADSTQIEFLLFSSSSLLCLLASTFFSFFGHTRSEVVFAAYLLFTIPLSAFGAVFNVWAYNRLPDVRTRCTIIGIAYGVFGALLAGPAPYVATQLVRTSWGISAPGHCISGLCLLGSAVISLTWWKKES